MGLFSDIKHASENRQKTEVLTKEIEQLKSLMTPEMREAAVASEKIKQLKVEIDALEKEKKQIKWTLQKLKKQKTEREAHIASLDDELLAQRYGLYRPRFDFAESSQFKERLSKCRKDQRDALKKFNSEASKTDWTVNGSSAEGKKMVKQTSRLLMMAYNSQCDEIVRNVKALNVEKSLEQVRKTADTINKLGSTMKISIPPIYVALKIQEVQLAFEYAKKKAEEKEALREAREQEREERKLQQEILTERKRLEKEKKQYLSAYKSTEAQLANASDSDSEALKIKLAELKSKLEDVDKAIANVDYREANRKAGYVYIISNIGSFGEGVYKIGMTRRLDPMERVIELSDASVPFNFDVHALIFSDDAPSLEAALHREFENKKVNLINTRREFFRVSLQEIEDTVRRNYDKTVEFHEVPDAEQWRASEKMREQGILQL